MEVVVALVVDSVVGVTAWLVEGGRGDSWGGGGGEDTNGSHDP